MDVVVGRQIWRNHPTMHMQIVERRYEDPIIC